MRCVILHIMALFEATKKAIELQSLVGTYLPATGLKVKAVLPAPVEQALFAKFVYAVKDEVINDNPNNVYADIADIIEASDFEVIVLYEGDFKKTTVEALHGIKWEWYK